MIRLVLAVVLTLALVGLSMPAVDRAGTVRTDERVGSDVATLDCAAAALLEHEELPPPGTAGPRRIVTLSLPSPSFTWAPVDYVVVGDAFDSGTDEGRVVAYRVDGGAERLVHVDAPIRTAGGDPLVLRGSGEYDLVLTLERDASDDPVVVVSLP